MTEMMVIMVRAPREAEKMASRECRMERIAAIRKVLSPNSDTKIIKRAEIKPEKKSYFFPGAIGMI